jgi:hypothetical protein
MGRITTLLMSYFDFISASDLAKHLLKRDRNEVVAINAHVHAPLSARQCAM